MPTGRVSAGAALMKGEVVLAGGIAGGSQGSGVVEAFNPTTGTWRTLPSLPEGREALGAGVIEGRFCVVGGRLERNRPPYSTVHCLTEDEKGWTTSAPMTRARSEFGYVMMNGVLYILGGQLVSGSETSYVDGLLPP